MSGFALLAAFTLLFAALFASDIGQFMAGNDYTNTAQDARIVEYERISDYRHANINITKIEYSSGTGTVYVQNTGGVVLDLDQVGFLLDGEWFPETNFQLSMSNEWWEPGEELRITFSQILSGGYHEAKVTTGEGVYATKRFYLPLVPKTMMVYHDSWAPAMPRYRTWNGSLWSNESAALNTGSTSTDTIRWLVIKASKTRNEFILGVLDSGDHVNVQIWQNGTWGNLLELTTTSDRDYRGFDITYESVSGDAIVVYNDGSTLPKYRIWNGTGWSSQGSVAAIGSGIPRWIVLASHPSTDEVVLATIDSAGSPDVYGQIWNGNTWGNVMPLETDAQDSKYQCFDVAYEQSTGRALVVWADDRSSSPQYRIWNSGWSGESSANSVGSNNIRWIKLASEPGSSRILMGTLDDSEDINVQTWTGSIWSNNTEVTTSVDKSDRRPFDVAWESSSGVGMVAYGLKDQPIPRYWTCSPSNCDIGNWNGEYTALDSTQGSTPWWVRLASDPSSNNIMLMHSDKQEPSNIGVQRWAASTWVDPFTVETNSLDESKSQAFDLTYSLYNPGG